MKSSVDPEVSSVVHTDVWASYAKNIPGISYVNVQTDNYRLCVLQIKSNSKVLLTIIGVYMLHYLSIAYTSVWVIISLLTILQYGLLSLYWLYFSMGYYLYWL